MHNFIVGFAMRVKIRAALGTANRQAGECVLEHLFKGQEFQNIEIYAGMEAQTAFVGANGAAHLHAETAVYMNFALIVLPGYAEGNHAFRLDNAFQNLLFLKFRMCFQHRNNAFQNLGYRVLELRLVRVAFCNQV